MDAGVSSSRFAPSLSLYTDSSQSGWGAHLLDFTASGVWPDEESQEHINILEMCFPCIVSPPASRVGCCPDE